MPRSHTNRPRWKTALGHTLYGLYLVVFLGIGAAGGFIGSSPFLKEVVLEKSLGIAPPTPEEVFDRDSMVVLLLGTDEDHVRGRRKPVRTNARSDTMIVVKLDFKNDLITGVSIPRDTVVSVPGYSRDKINAFHAYGSKESPEKGRELAKQAAEELLGIGIDRVVMLDYDAIREMVRLVDGVTVDVEKRLRYRDRAAGFEIDIPSGPQRLDAEQAIGYLRFRHDRQGDFGRQERQQKFLVAFKNEVTSKVGAVPAVIEAALKTFGDGMEPAEVRAIAHFAKDLGDSRIRLGQVPVVDEPTGRFGSALLVQESELAKVLEEFRLVEGVEQR